MADNKNDDDEYISIFKIKSNILDDDFVDADDAMDELNENSKEVYQVQGYDDNATAVIMKVGLMKDLHDILIKEFDILSKFKCYMISRMFNAAKLEHVSEHCTFQMVKVNIFHNNNNEHIASLSYNFKTFAHAQNKTSIMNYVSDKQQTKELYGFFSITLHFKENNQNKYITLENNKTFPGKTEMLIKLTKWLLDPKVQESLNKLI